jgi:hypothetical protein
MHAQHDAAGEDGRQRHIEGNERVGEQGQLERRRDRPHRQDPQQLMAAQPGGQPQAGGAEPGDREEQDAGCRDVERAPGPAAADDAR